MAYNVSQLKTDLTGILHGTNLNKIQGLDQLIDRGAREVLLDVDPTETIRIGQLGLLFDDVFQVALPSDLKGNKVIDIRPQSQQRNLGENVSQKYMREFSLFKDRTFGIVDFNVQHNTGIKTLQVDNPNLPAGAVVNDLGAVTSNGTWTVFGDAANLEADSIVYAQGASSLRFDMLGGGTTGGIEITMDAAVDLSDKENISTLFEFGYLPDASVITSVQLKWGSSSTDYWTQIVTTDVSGNALVNFWNQFGFTWNAATTEVGTPDATAVTNLQITVTTDGSAQSGFRFDRITNTEGIPQEIVYYSKFLFSNSGIFSETVTNNNTVINLDTESYNLLTYKCAQLAFQQQHDFADRGGQESDKFAIRYQLALDRYKAQYKSELVKPKSFYYRPDFSNRGLRRGGNRLN